MQKMMFILICALAVAGCGVGNKPDKSDATEQILHWMHTNQPYSLFEITNLTYSNGSEIDENTYEVDVDYTQRLRDATVTPYPGNDAFIFKKTENGWLLQEHKS